MNRSGSVQIISHWKNNSLYVGKHKVVGGESKENVGEHIV